MSLRTGGREAVEDTPVTGATDSESQPTLSQDAIEALAMTIPGLWAEAMQEAVLMSRAMSESGYVIVRTEDVLTAEARAAIGRLVRSTAAGKLAQTLARAGQKCVAGSPLWEAAEEELAALDAITDDDVARFRAIAAGGTE